MMNVLNFSLVCLGGLLHVLLLLLSRGVAGDPSGKQCEPAPGREETCVCKTEGGVIDLTPFSNQDGTPRFANLPDNSDQDLKYSYNPCNTFKDVKSCDEVFICQYLTNGDNVNIAPPLSEEMWIEEDGTPYVFYPNPDNNRESKVYLNCDQGVGVEKTVTIADGEIEGRLHYVGIKGIASTNPQQYCDEKFFNISSCQVCPGGCRAKPAPVEGIIGLVLITVAIYAVVTYFVVGALINKFYRKAFGKDIIPHREFWFQLPILIKDGFVFTFGPCYRLILAKARSRQGYQTTN